MKSNAVRQQWRDVLDYVGHGGTVIVEHYSRPVARIIPMEEATMTEPREIDIDPATITRLDGREYYDPIRRAVLTRMTVGTTPDGTPVVIVEDCYDDERGMYLTEMQETVTEDDLKVSAIWAYPSIEDARCDRDEQIESQLLPRDLVNIRNVTV